MRSEWKIQKYEINCVFKGPVIFMPTENTKKKKKNISWSQFMSS